MSLVSGGRTGFRSLGIGPGGAMDQFAMRTSNFLVGNDREAVIELGYSSAEILFRQDCVASVTGNGFFVEINEVVVPFWKPFKIKAGVVLKLKKNSAGAWTYLAVHGGWEAQEWLGSLTTNLSAGAGGFNGKALQKNDEVNIDKAEVQIDEIKILPWGISTIELNGVYSSVKEVRCIASVETNLLSQEAKEKITSQEFVVSNKSNRMGYRLHGPSLSLSEPMELISSPVDFGTIQLLPDGNLIVLMADHQTTGGYPRIASVIKADLPKLAQAMPGEKIRFKMISLTDAESEWRFLEQRLVELKRSCHLQFRNHFKI